MKKAIFLLIVLVIAGLAILFFGWISIPENNAGVFFSSITGYEDKLLQTGEFHWRWQKLIPRTWKLYLAETSPRRTDITIKGLLPSGDIYSFEMPGNPDFTYSVSLTAIYNLDNRYILESVITGKSGISSENISALYTDADTLLNTLIKDYIDNKLAEITIHQPDKEIISGKDLSIHIQDKTENIRLQELTVNNQVFPDIRLYLNAVSHYEELSDKKKELLLDTGLKNAAFETDLEKRLEALEKYGQLLTKYPILLEYLKANPEGDILRESRKLESSN